MLGCWHLHTHTHLAGVEELVAQFAGRDGAGCTPSVAPANNFYLFMQYVSIYVQVRFMLSHIHKFKYSRTLPM